MRLLATFNLLALVLGGVAFVAYGQTVAPEQKLFTDMPFSHPVSLSPDALRVLLASHPAADTFDVLSDAEKRDPAQLFQAAEVHLGAPDEIDLVVIGLGKMRGAENRWFWVVRSARQNPQVILFGGGDSLEVTDKKTHGLKDIRVVWMSSTETETSVYQFDGGSYQTRNLNNFKLGTSNP